jgi:hypothetical protein
VDAGSPVEADFRQENREFSGPSSGPWTPPDASGSFCCAFWLYFQPRSSILDPFRDSDFFNHGSPFLKPPPRFGEPGDHGAYQGWPGGPHTCVQTQAVGKTHLRRVGPGHSRLSRGTWPPGATRNGPPLEVPARPGGFYRVTIAGDSPAREWGGIERASGSSFQGRGRGGHPPKLETRSQPRWVARGSAPWHALRRGPVVSKAPPTKNKHKKWRPSSVHYGRLV